MKIKYFAAVQIVKLFTGHILRVEVKVDAIRSLQIVTKTHELLLDEAPEAFEVRAYDEKMNEFSTLDGVVFKWDAKERSDVLRFINFRDSAYDFDYASTSQNIEAKGQQGRKVLLEGVKTGSSKVSVRLVSRAYNEKALPPCVTSTTVVVVANIYLVPQSAYIMIGGVVKYRAEQIKSNQVHEISLASSRQYDIETLNSDIASVKTNELIRGNALGSTSVVLQDKNVDTTVFDDEVRRPSGELYVVIPDHITINIDPHQSPMIIIGNWYDINVEVFDSDNHRLIPSENWLIELEVNPNFFEVLNRSDNGAFIHGSPITVGITEVHATLLGTRDLATGEKVTLPYPLSDTAELSIFEPILLKPQRSVFPWDPLSPISEQVPYEIQWPSGITNQEVQFSWSSTNSSIATVTQNGVAKTTGYGPGTTEIIASMSRSMHNQGNAKIVVLPTLDLKILKQNIVIEAELGNTLNIPIAFYADVNQNTPFTKCVQLPYKVMLEKQDSFVVSNDRVEPLKIGESCTNVALKAHNVGFARLDVAYKYQHEEKPINLRDSAYIAAFKPLTPLQPYNGVALLAVDSSLDLAWSGGPNPWASQGEKHFAEISIGDNTIVNVEKMPRSVANKNINVYIYQAKCNKLGESTVTLKVGHHKSKFLSHPVVSSSTITVTCAQPEKIQLKADVITPESESKCPLMAKSGRIAAQCYEDLPVRVLVYDIAGKKFDNISTLDLSWEISDKELGTLSSHKGVIFPEAHENRRNSLGFRVSIDEFPHQILHTKNKPGNLDISITLQRSSSWTTGFSSALTDTLPLNLVKDAELFPEELSVFHHPANKGNVNINHGSGYFEVNLANEVAKQEYIPSNQTVQIIPLKNGKSSLIVKDLCLLTRKEASTQVSVVGVQKVELIVDDKVQKGNSIDANVRLLDHNGLIIHPDSKFVDVSLEITQKMKQNILSIKRMNTSLTSGEILFHIRGEEVGTIAISATATYNVNTVKSSSKRIQVFPPIRLEPRNITLIIGAKFQIRASGGPNEPNMQIEYTLESKGMKIVSANPIGIVTGLTLGSTKVTGRVMGTDKLTNEKTIVSEDTVNIHVIKLEGIKISSPIVRMKVNTEIPIIAVGSKDPINQNAYSFGSAIPNLKFSWSINNGEVAELRSVFHDNGVTGYGMFNTASMRLKAKKAGRILVKLKAQITSTLEGNNQYQFDKDAEFKDQLEIQVFDDLAFTNPNLLPSKRSLLMQTNSEYQLKTTRDGIAKILSYQVIPKINANKDIVAITGHGLIKSRGESGSCVVLVEVVEAFGAVQKLTLLIEVKPITFMMINVLPVFAPSDTKQGLKFVPRGVGLPVELSFHDEIGEKFDSLSLETQDDLIIRPSRFDTNQIQRTYSKPAVIDDNNPDNKTAQVFFVMEMVKDNTLTVLKASLDKTDLMSGQKENSRMQSTWQDFVVIDVQRAIQPSNPKIIVGDVISFRSQMEILNRDKNAESYGGQWLVEPKGYGDINPNNGWMTAIKAGQVQILYSNPMNMNSKTSINIDIRPPGKLILLKDKLSERTVLTNKPDKIQYVPVVILGKENFISTNNEMLAEPNPYYGKNFHSFRPKSVIDQENENLQFNALQTSAMFHCHARFLSLEHEIANYLKVNAGFDITSGTYACYFTPTEVLDNQVDMASEVELIVTPGEALLAYAGDFDMGDKTQLSFFTGFKSLTNEILLTNVHPSANIELKGLSGVLDKVLVELSHPHLLRIGRAFVDSSDDNTSGTHGSIQKHNVPITVKSAFWIGDKETMSASLYAIVSFGAQSIRIPINIRFRSDQCGNIELGWSSILYFLFDHYQSVLMIILSCIICTYITKVSFIKFLKSYIPRQLSK